MKSLVTILCCIFLVSSSKAQTPVFQPVTAREILPSIQNTVLTDFAADAHLTAAMFVGISYQGVSMQMDLQNGKATGWVYRWYSPQRDTSVYYFGFKLPIIGVQSMKFSVDTLSQSLPIGVLVNPVVEPWTDSPQALDGSKNGGASDFFQKNPNANVLLAAVFNNPAPAGLIPQGTYWLFRYGGTSDTLTCVVDAGSALPVTCLSNHAPKITSAPRTTAFVNDQYSYTVTATGIPEPTYSFTTKPDGMSIDATSGTITWTPAASQTGDHSVVVVATNEHGTDSQSFVITVQPPAIAPRITSKPPTEAVAKSTFTYQLSATGTPTPRFRLNSSPTGMVLDEGRGKLTWVPTAAQAGPNEISVSAINIGGEDTQVFQLMVYNPPKFKPFPPLFIIHTDSLFTYTLEAEGLPAPSIILVSGPQGLTIDSLTGMISWTPTRQQVGQFTVSIDARNRAGSQTLTFDVRVELTTGIPRPEEGNLLSVGSVYPNPISGSILSLPITISSTTSVSIELWDLLGRRVTPPLVLQLLEGRHIVPLVLAGALPGRYIVALRSNGRLVTQPLLIMP